MEKRGSKFLLPKASVRSNFVLFENPWKYTVLSVRHSSALAARDRARRTAWLRGRRGAPPGSVPFPMNRYIIII